MLCVFLCVFFRVFFRVFFCVFSVHSSTFFYTYLYCRPTKQNIGQRPTTAAGHLDNVSGRRPRPTARLMGRDVRDRTSLRSPPPQLGILPHVRRV